MCLHPKKFFNPTHSFTPGISKLDVTIPCNKCDECRSIVQNEWFLRCYAEFMQNKANGGVCYFLTLTYADEFLPYFDVDYNSLDGTRKHLHTSCFSYEHIHTFINTLRKYLKRKFGDIRLKFIIFPEYGSHTKRPHYHCLFWLDRFISSKSFFALIDGYDNDYERRKFYHWRKDKPYFRTKDKSDGINFRGAWHYGWCLVSKPEKGGMIVNSQKSIMYCSKYATKDISYYSKSDIKDFLNSIYDKSISQDYSRDYYIKLFNPCSPRHRQSPSLGYNWLSCKFMSDYNKYIRDGFVIQVGQKDSLSYQLPEYYKRKLLYRYEVTQNEDGTKKVRWYFNSDKSSVHLAYLRYNVHRYRLIFDSIKSYNLYKCCDVSDLSYLGFDSFESLNGYIRSIFSKYTSYQLSVFKCVFAGRHTVDNDSYLPLIHYISNYEQYYLRFIDNTDLEDVGYSILSKEHDLFKSSYDTLPCFDGMSQFLSICSYLDSKIRIYEYNFKSFLDDVKDMFTPLQDHFTPFEIL